MDISQIEALEKFSKIKKKTTHEFSSYFGEFLGEFESVFSIKGNLTGKSER